LGAKCWVWGAGVVISYSKGGNVCTEAGCAQALLAVLARERAALQLPFS